MKTIFEDENVTMETEKLDGLRRQSADLRQRLKDIQSKPYSERLQTQANKLLSGEEIEFEDQNLARKLQVTELAIRTQENRLFEAKQSAGKRLWSEVEPEGNRLRNDTLSALQNLREAVSRERVFFDQTLPSIGLSQDLNCIGTNGPCRELCQTCGPLDDNAGQQASPLGRWLEWYRGG